MPESSMILYTFQELAELMVKHQGIHEGLWGIYLKFGIGAVNAADPSGQLIPTALVPVREIGLQKFDEPNNLAVDAAKVNRPKGAKKAKATKRRASLQRERTYKKGR
jgi:hypothetical protein